jgi:hypothetical protein
LVVGEDGRGDRARGKVGRTRRTVRLSAPLETRFDCSLHAGEP